MNESSTVSPPLDALIVGAGFSGLYTLHKLRAQRPRLRARVLEAGSGPGGTWYWNGYPGARCDSDSVEYSYSFDHDLEQEWRWSERFASQPEILRYLEHVADRFELRRDIQLDTRVTTATYDETRDRWTVTTTAGEVFEPQRTANFSIPAQNAPLDDAAVQEVKGSYGELREKARRAPGGLGSFEIIGGRSAMRATAGEREAAFEKGWAKGGAHILGSFADLMFNPASNEQAQRFVAAKIRQTVHDPETARTLTPDDHPLGAKRICVDTGYYATFDRPNVSLVDLRTTPIEAMTPAGIRTSAGLRLFDSVVFATGFDAMTGALAKIDIRGVGARRCRTNGRTVLAPTSG